MALIQRPTRYVGASYVAFVYLPGVGIRILDGASVGTLVEKYTPYGDDAILLCAFKDLTGRLSSVYYYKKYETLQRLNDQMAFSLTRDDLRELYRDWRVAFASGWCCSELFNLHYGVYNPVIEQHDTFDIRLGYLIITDRRVQALIGRGNTLYNFDIVNRYKKIGRYAICRSKQNP